MQLAALQEAVAAIRLSSPLVPQVGVVLGSGLSALARHVDDACVVPYASIPHFAPCTIAGHGGDLILGTIAKVPCAVLSGRVHYYEGYDLEQVTFPIRVLAALGVDGVLLSNAAGGLHPDFSPGTFMVIADHLNLTGSNPLRGPNDAQIGARFPDMSEAYVKAGRVALHEAAKTIGITLREGVYAGVCGPSYETPAEVRMLQKLGADAVGMSTVAETIAAVHAGVKVAALSMISNPAAGLAAAALTHTEVVATGARMADTMVRLLQAATPLLAAAFADEPSEHP